AHRLGRGAVLDAARPRQHAAGHGADHLELEQLVAVAIVDRAVGGDVFRSFGEAAQLQDAAQAVRARHHGHAHPLAISPTLCHDRKLCTTQLASPAGSAASLSAAASPAASASGAASAAGALPAAGAAAAASASASAFFAAISWARLPVPRQRVAFWVMPAASRKRATRSLGLAPTPSQ